MSDKLSVIVSVGRGPGLQPPLPGAYMGHAEYKAWAQTQGHDIVEFTDENGDVFDTRDIESAITGPVDDQSLTELWIYFAGHGECSSLEEDYWLLKREGASSADIVNVGSSTKLARRAGIPRVVIISDACRTTGDALSMALHAASSTIVPPRNFDAITPRVDRLLAAGPGTAALEVHERQQAAISYGVFTRELMRALRGEVPETQERHPDGGRMVVTPAKLRMYLELKVQSVAGSIAGGYPQRPDCIFESAELLATTRGVPSIDVRISTEYTDGTPVENTTISLLMHRFDNWEQFDEVPGPSASFPAPSGLMYKAVATGPCDLTPENPMPLFELHSPTSGRFLAGDQTDRATEETLASAPAEFALTRVLDEFGGMHSKAPAAGVFRVVSYDPVCNQMASQIQEFTSDNLTPSKVPTPIAGREIEQNIIQAAQTHGRETFETRVGLTLVGLPESTEPVVAADPGLLAGVFFEDGQWSIRGTRSGSVVIRLGERFFPVPMFNDLVGTIRLANTDSRRPTLSDLSFAPADGTDYDFDLVRPWSPESRISQNDRDELDALQMIVTRCARNGFFEVAIDEAAGLADRIRMLKHHNPIFGIIAAYAYDKADRRDQIVDMVEWFDRKSQSIPFDLVMLANMNSTQVMDLVTTPSSTIVPHVAPNWPMITQGWSRLSDEHLSEFAVLREVREALVPGFWTTVSGTSGENLFNQVNEGSLKWI